MSIRADLAYSTGIGSVRLELTGPVSVTRVENTDGLPVSLFGDDGGGGDYNGGWLPDGAYTLTATPYSGQSGRGDAFPGLMVTFTVTGSIDPDASPVTGFTLVDARDRAPDPDLGPIADGATVDVAAADGRVGIRADVANAGLVRSVRLELTGPVSASRLENAPAPYALFGDDGQGDYRPARLAAGAYRLKATPYGGRDGGGSGAARARGVVHDPVCAADRDGRGGCRTSVRRGRGVVHGDAGQDGGEDAAGGRDGGGGAATRCPACRRGR